jgi:hypothetical protein
MLASDSTKIICIGVAEYQSPDLRLQFASLNAASLANAFKEVGGCGIPKENIHRLLDEDAERARILNTIRSVSESCIPNDILILYFSGHGRLAGASYYLLPVDADPNNLSASAIESEELRAAMSECMARGILVILDCCQGAGFAENASRLFTTIGAQEFRIILCASRAGQSSFEFNNFRGTIFSHHLTEVVSGRVALGEHPGIVFFSDLFEYLAARLGEDLEALGYSPDIQEAVFVGTYAKDPRLFILRQVALTTLDLESPKYSRKFVRRARRRMAWSLVGSVALLLLAYYYYLDHSLYLGSFASQVNGHEGSYLAVLRGDPRINGLAFPHFVRALDLPYSSLPNAPGIRSFSTQTLDTRMIEALPTEWRAVLEGWKGDTGGLERFVKQADNNIDLPDDPPGLTVAVELLGEMKGSAAAAQLEENAEPMAPSRAAAAMRQIARFDSSRALDLYQDGMEGLVPIQLAILQGLTGPCPDDGPKVLESLSTYTYDRNQGKSMNVEPDTMRAPWWAATLRSGCKLNPKTFKEVYDHEIYRDNERDLNVLAYLVLHHDNDVLDGVERDLRIQMARILKRDKKVYWLDSFEAEHRAWSDLRLLAALRPNARIMNIDRLLAFDLDKNVKLSAARWMLAHEKDDPRVLESAKNDLWIVAALVDSGWYDDQTVHSVVSSSIARSKPFVGQDFSGALRYFIRMVRRHKINRAAAVLEEIGRTAQDQEVVVDAGMTLDMLEPTKLLAPKQQSTRTQFFDPVNTAHVFPLPKSQYSLTQTLSPADPIFPWYVAHYDIGFDGFKTGLQNDTLSSVTAIMGLPLSESAKQELRSLLKDSRTKYSAAAILAARGGLEDVRLILESPDVEIRQEGTNYAILNPGLPSFLQTEPSGVVGTDVKTVLSNQLIARMRIEDRVLACPASVRGLMLGALVAGDFANTPGLKLWSDTLIRSFDGNTEDGAEALTLFDGH